MQRIKSFNKLIIVSVILLISVITIFVSFPSKVYASEVEAVSDTTIENSLEDYSNYVYVFEDFELNTIYFDNDISTYSFSYDVLISYGGNSFVNDKLDLVHNKNYSYLCSYYEGNLIVLSGSVIDDLWNVNLIIKSSIKLDSLFINYIKNCYSNFETNESYVDIYKQAFNDGYQQGVNSSALSDGIYDYLDYLEYDLMNNSIEYSLSDLKNNGFYKDKKLNLFEISLIDNSNYDSVNIDMYFIDLPLSQFDLFFSGFNNVVVKVYDINNRLLLIDMYDKNTLNYNDILSLNPSFNDISCISISGSSPDCFGVISSDSSYSLGYNAGYQGGYIVGSNSGYDNGYNEGYQQGMQDEDNNKTNYDNGYNDGYDRGYVEGKEYGFENAGDLAVLPKNFLNAMFSTPLNIFKSLLNWEFFGINLFGVLTSLLTIAVVVFLFRKFKK